MHGRRREVAQWQRRHFLSAPAGTRVLSDVHFACVLSTPGAELRITSPAGLPSGPPRRRTRPALWTAPPRIGWSAPARTRGWQQEVGALLNKTPSFVEDGICGHTWLQGVLACRAAVCPPAGLMQELLAPADCAVPGGTNVWRWALSIGPAPGHCCCLARPRLPWGALPAAKAG